MMTHASFLAVLKDGTHRTMTAHLPAGNLASFRAWVRLNTHDIRYTIARFVYAWGGEMQEYTAAEVREVFHGVADVERPITYSYPE
jgi:hypothetical protein